MRCGERFRAAGLTALLVACEQLSQMNWIATLAQAREVDLVISDEQELSEEELESYSLGLRLDKHLRVTEFVPDEFGYPRDVQGSGKVQVLDTLVSINGKKLTDLKFAQAIRVIQQEQTRPRPLQLVFESDSPNMESSSNHVPSHASEPKIKRAIPGVDGVGFVRVQLGTYLEEFPAIQSEWNIEGLKSAPTNANEDDAATLSTSSVLCRHLRLRDAGSEVDACSTFPDGTDFKKSLVYVHSSSGCPAHEKARHVMEANGAGVIMSASTTSEPLTRASRPQRHVAQVAPNERVMLKSDLSKRAVKSKRYRATESDRLIPLVMISHDSGKRLESLVFRDKASKLTNAAKAQIATSKECIVDAIETETKGKASTTGNTDQESSDYMDYTYFSSNSGTGRVFDASAPDHIEPVAFEYLNFKHPQISGRLHHEPYPIISLYSSVRNNGLAEDVYAYVCGEKNDEEELHDVLQRDHGLHEFHWYGKMVLTKLSPDCSVLDQSLFFARLGAHAVAFVNDTLPSILQRTCEANYEGVCQNENVVEVFQSHHFLSPLTSGDESESPNHGATDIMDIAVISVSQHAARELSRTSDESAAKVSSEKQNSPLNLMFSPNNAIRQFWYELSVLQDPSEWPGSNKNDRALLFSRVAKHQHMIHSTDQLHNDRYEVLIGEYYKAEKFYDDQLHRNSNTAGIAK